MKDDITAFQEFLSVNLELQKEVEFLRSKYDPGVLSVKDTCEFLRNDLIPFARSKGYNFTVEDYINHEIEEEQSLLHEDFMNVSGGLPPFKLSYMLLIATSIVLGGSAGAVWSRNSKPKVSYKNYSEKKSKPNTYESEDQEEDSKDEEDEASLKENPSKDVQNSPVLSTPRLGEINPFERPQPQQAPHFQQRQPYIANAQPFQSRKNVPPKQHNATPGGAVASSSSPSPSKSVASAPSSPNKTASKSVVERVIEGYLQKKNGYEDALKQISNGKKETHWMWYIFPQLSGLGESDISKSYGLTLEDAKKLLSDNRFRDKYFVLMDSVKYNRVNQGIDLKNMFCNDRLKFLSSLALFYFAMIVTEGPEKVPQPMRILVKLNITDSVALKQFNVTYEKLKAENNWNGSYAQQVWDYFRDSACSA
ncbi:MAG: DUF1810 domain-containing protein [Oscillospiraceae bacterium]|jgi:uncharacterized protein (DUF1810 family)|nr:DUF1810 domain-containing protein [Oscillospiraceae bacterium]